MLLKIGSKKGLKVYFFYGTEGFGYWSLCIAVTSVFCLLQHYIAALHLFNVAATFSLTNLSRHFHRYLNLIINLIYLFYCCL